MRTRLLTTLMVVALFALSFSCKQSSSKADPGPVDEVAVLDTDFGRIVIEFYPNEAPNHVANFKKLTREGFYDGTAFHRIDKSSGVIQGGDPNSKTNPNNPATWGQGQPDQPKVDAEFNVHQNIRGSLGAARSQDINSATSQFFVNLRDNSEGFDRPGNQYTVFGHVIDGMNVVDIIADAPTDPTSGQMPRPRDRINICKAVIVKKDQVASLPPASASCK